MSSTAALPLPDVLPAAPGPWTGMPLVERVDALLPQTQCTRCGFADCRGYAQAIATAEADIDRCPPGGDEGVRRLALLLDRAAPPLNPDYGVEGPRRLVFIAEAACIGCTLCIQACPVDAIIGAPKRMHAVIESVCTGCELCIPVCPVDCIELEVASGEATGWDAWSSAQADAARARHSQRRARLQQDELEQARRLASRSPGTPRPA